MDHHLRSYLAQERRDRYYAQAEQGRLLATLQPRQPRTVATRRKVGAALILMGQRLQGATTLPDTDVLPDPVAAVQTNG